MVNSLNENKSLYEIICLNNIAYVLNDSNAFLPTEYKVLQNQANSCFVKCMKLYFNGNIQLYYLTEGYTPFLNLLTMIDGDGFIVVMTNLFANIISIKNNGFLSCQNIDIEPNHIFVDHSTLKTYLIYLPVENRHFYNISSFENELKTVLIKLIRN